MSERLSSWRFAALWVIAFVTAAGYLAGNIPWEKIL